MKEAGRMRVVQINLGNHGSTGSIAIGINEVAKSEGIETYFAYPWDSSNKPSQNGDILIGTKFGRRASRKLGKITGYNGCFSIFATMKFLHTLNRIKPDIIHLHNLHNCYINLPMLFHYIKKHNVRTIWTLHDCWAFTGQCPYFSLVNCMKWKTGCHDCPQIDRYPPANVDRTRLMWKLKRKWFTGVKNMTIVTPSQWLADLVKESYLKEYDIKVINNGIDLNVFRPTKGDFEERMSNILGGGTSTYFSALHLTGMNEKDWMYLLSWQAF